MKEFVKSEKGKCLYWIIGIVVGLIYAFILVPPLFGIVNKIDPTVFGWPLIAFMELLFAIVLSVALVLVYWVQKVRGEL